MARIRTIKPEFFRHEQLFEAEKASKLPLRVAFAGMFTAADREGRFRWQPRVLKLDVLPFDDVDFSRALEALAKYGFIVKYEVDGSAYGYIPSWPKHQYINNRETESDLPAPDGRTVISAVRVSAATCTDQNSPGYVYIAVAVEARAAKIGFCERLPEQRLHDLSCGSPEELVLAGYFEGNQAAEADLRNGLAKYKTRREWIHWSEAAWHAIDEIVTRDGRVKHAWGTRQGLYKGEGKGREGEGKVDDACASSLTSSSKPEEPPPIPGLDPEAWDRWQDYRKQIRKPIKPVSIPAAQRELAGFGADQCAVVEQSVANSYQGLFALKHRPKREDPPRNNGLQVING